MIVERYSWDGFKPQYQNYHINSIKNIINIDLSQYNDEIKVSLLPIIKEKKEFFFNYSDILSYGIWCFIKDYKNEQSLNHIKGILPPKWLAYIPDDTIVFDVNWQYTMKITDERITHSGCFIPEKWLDKILYCGNN